MFDELTQTDATKRNSLPPHKEPISRRISIKALFITLVIYDFIIIRFKIINDRLRRLNEILSLCSVREGLVVR